MVDDTNTYPTLLGIEQAIENQTIINFKKRILSFEYIELQVVTPIDPMESQRYIKKVNSEGQEGYLDNIYNISSTMDDYVNLIANGNLIQRSISSCKLESGESLENQHNRLHEVSMRKCARIISYVRRVGTQVCDLPAYELFPSLDTLLTQFKEKY